MKRVFALLLLPLLLLGCRTETAHSAAGFACDTVVTVTAYAPQETVDATLRICSDYEKVLSKTIAGSDIDRLNRAGGVPVGVQPETAALLALAVEIGAVSVIVSAGASSCGAGSGPLWVSVECAIS